MFDKFYITNKGLEYFASTGTGKNLVITRASYGNGLLSSQTDQKTITSLVNKLADMQIISNTVLENTITIKTAFSNYVNNAVLPAFNLMEIGIFGRLEEDGVITNQEALICYINAVEEEYSDYIPAVLTEFFLDFPLTVSNSVNVTLESANIVFVTEEEFKDKINKKADKVIPCASGNVAILTSEGNLADAGLMLSVVNGILRVTYDNGVS